MMSKLVYTLFRKEINKYPSVKCVNNKIRALSYLSSSSSSSTSSSSSSKTSSSSSSLIIHQQRCVHLLKHLHQPQLSSSSSSSPLMLQQIRHKGNKGSSRFKLPPVPKEKETREFKRLKPKIIEEIPAHEKSETPSEDDVWNRRYFPVPKYLFLEAINRHREFASPEMTDNLEGVVILEAELDLTTKKKTKFLGAPEGMILLPHNFDNFLPGRVIAITKTDEDRMRAELAGATYTGGLDLIKKIERGEIKSEDYDHVVLNNDMLVEAAILKKILKDQFPNKKTGNLGIDVETMVKLFVNGKEYQASKLSDALGMFTFPIGKLSMTDEQLTENVKAILESVGQVKPGGELFSKISLTCPPSKEIFIVDDESIVPIPVTKVVTKAGGKKFKMEEDEEEEKGEEKRATG